MLQDEILMPTNPGLDRESLNERAAGLQEEMSTKKAALAEVLESEGLDIDLALQVMEEVLEHLPSIFNHLQDDEKASFAFVLLPEKVICKDKKLQTPAIMLLEMLWKHRYLVEMTKSNRAVA